MHQVSCGTIYGIVFIGFYWVSFRSLPEVYSTDMSPRWGWLGFGQGYLDTFSYRHVAPLGLEVVVELPGYRHVAPLEQL